MCGCGFVLLSNVRGDGCVRDGGSGCSSVPNFTESQKFRQSFSPTAVGERRLNLAKSLRSNVMRWHDATLAMIDWFRLSSKQVEWCPGFRVLPTPHRHLPKQVMFWFHFDSSKRRMGVVGDATFHERTVPILRQLPCLALQHTHALKAGRLHPRALEPDLCGGDTS